MQVQDLCVTEVKQKKIKHLSHSPKVKPLSQSALVAAAIYAVTKVFWWQPTHLAIIAANVLPGYDQNLANSSEYIDVKYILFLLDINNVYLFLKVS